MNITEFYESYKWLRGICIAVAVLGMLVFAIEGYCYTVEAEYAGPGSEAERLNDSCRDRDNRDAYDRVNEGSRDQRDVDRASAYERDHGA